MVFAAPVHQMKEYYVYGEVDDCSGHWKKLFACLKSKTSRFKDDSADENDHGNVAQQPLWKLRNKEEARQFWSQEFASDEQPSGEQREKNKEGSSLDSCDSRKPVTI